MVFCVLYVYCQSYSDLRGYADKGKSYSDIRGCSDKGKGRWYSVYCTRTVRVQRYSDRGGMVGW